MLSPLLIIGVGGAGGKTIRAMKQELNRILESSGHTDGIPAAWQFLQIDTNIYGGEFPAPMLSNDEIHCVVPTGVSYGEILGSIMDTGSVSEQQQMLAGWGIPMPRFNEVDMMDPQIMAGNWRYFMSHRAPNRIMSVGGASKTLQAIQRSIAKMSSPTAISELASVANCMGSRIPVDNPQAFIVSSLGGGSGSGMFMDVAEILKRATPQNWAQQSISFLYTPDVFRSTGRNLTDIVSKNTLAAMNELIASQLVGVSEGSELVYSKMGLVRDASSGRQSFGCRTNLLISGRNNVADISDGVSGAGMNEVFLAIGESLAAAISNEDVYEFLRENYTYRSWSHGAMEISGLAPEKFQGMTGLSSIGFGKMTSGADRIVEYVADALTRRQVEKLLWPELTPVLSKGGISVKELVQEKADENWSSFLLCSGLDERGPQSQIVDALLPEQVQERIKQFVSRIIEKNVTDEPRPFATFTQAIWFDWEIESIDFLTKVKSEMNGKAQKWVPSIQDKLRDQFASELMLNGYAVLSNQIERLEVELRDHVVPELLLNHKEYSKFVDGFDRHIYNKRINEIAEGLTGVSAQSGSFLEKLSQSLARVLEIQVNLEVSALVVSLVRDMLSHFIAPLKDQISDSRFDLLRTQRSELLPDGSRNSFREYPDWGSGIVPDPYKSRSLERILIDSGDYESTYDFYASKDSQGAPAFQKSVSAALLGKKMNPMLGDLNLQTLITVRSPWITNVREAQETTGTIVSKFEWNFHTDTVELSKRNRHWLRLQESAFGKFSSMSIREYVGAAGEAPHVRAQREHRFTTEYRFMLKLAQPLVEINPLAMRHIHTTHGERGADNRMIWTNKIPFSMSSNVGKECKRVLEENGYNLSDPGFEQNWFNPESNDLSMFAASTIQNTLPTWAFASLTEPILEQVERSKNMPQTWSQLWNGRRTRPLIESIPFETEMRRSIIAGWFVASLFGMRKVNRGPVGRSVQIWNPTLETSGWSSFPSPLLAANSEDSRHESWVLPQLLMSAGIALANFGKTGNPEFIHGYRLLKYLGREVTTSMANRDMWDANGAGDLLPTGELSQSHYLKNWVISGEMPDTNLELLQLLQESLALSDSRSAALIQTVEVIRAQYNDIWNEFSSTAWHSLPETWELKEDIDLALNDIARYVSELRNSTPSNIA
jgi:hypothetical protein